MRNSALRLRPMAACSAMKMMAGAAWRALVNRSRTRDAPTPTIASTNSDADWLKKGTLASPATARASNVLPVPGGPIKRTPLGTVPPSRVYFCGSRRKSTSSSSSCLTSSIPATSATVVPGRSGSYSLAGLCPEAPRWVLWFRVDRHSMLLEEGLEAVVGKRGALGREVGGADRAAGRLLDRSLGHACDRISGGGDTDDVPCRDLLLEDVIRQGHGGGLSRRQENVGDEDVREQQDAQGDPEAGRAKRARWNGPCRLLGRWACGRWRAGHRC